MANMGNGEDTCPSHISSPHGLDMIPTSHPFDPSSSLELCVGTHNSLMLSVGRYPCRGIGADFSSSLMADSCARDISCARASLLLRSLFCLVKTTSATSVAMSNVPRDTPTPAPTAIVFEVPWQRSASMVDAHVGFEAAAAVLNTLVVEMLVLPLDSTTLNVTVSVMAAACVGNPSALAVDDSPAVSLQQFSFGSLGSRQQ